MTHLGSLVKTHNNIIRFLLSPTAAHIYCYTNTFTVHLPFVWELLSISAKFEVYLLNLVEQG